MTLYESLAHLEEYLGQEKARDIVFRVTRDYSLGSLRREERFVDYLTRQLETRERNISQLTDEDRQLMLNGFVPALDKRNISLGF